MKRVIMFMTAAFLVLGSGAVYANQANQPNNDSAGHDTTQQPDYNSDDYSFSLSGNGVCQSDGTFLITWTINNTSSKPYINTSNPAMNVVSETDSDNSVTPVPVGSGIVDANATKTFTQTTNGTSGTTSLEAVGSWNTDTEDTFTSKTSVLLNTNCPQPKPATTTVDTVTGPTVVTPIVSPIVPGFTGK